MSNTSLPRFFIFFLFVLAPLGANANVVFTEIMYDAPGADTGHEWIEIQNTGPDAVDLKNWRFAEGGVNHKLTPVVTTLIPAGGYAVIVQDAKKFSADYGTFSGILFDSSFSLGNTGDSFALLNASSTQVATNLYTSLAGAAGDGNTLNFVNGTWVPRSPSPAAPVSERAITPVPKASVAAPVSGNSAHAASVRGGSKGKGTSTPTSAAPALAGQAETANAAQSGASSGILPWVFGLAAVIMVGIGAVWMMPKKKPEDSYTIIEDK